MDIKDRELARALLNPKLTNIIKAVSKEALTVKEIASRLDETPSRLYYHINKLEELGLIKVEKTKQVRHLTEKYFKAAHAPDENYNIDEAFARENPDFLIKQLMMVINKGIEQLDKDLRLEDQAENYRSQASILNGTFTKEEWQKLNQEICELINKRHEESEAAAHPERKPITFTLMSFENPKEDE